MQSSIKAAVVSGLMILSTAAYAGQQNGPGSLATNPSNPGTQGSVSDHSLTPPDAVVGGKSTKTTFDDERDANMGENLGNPVLRNSTIGKKTTTVSTFGLGTDQVRQAQSQLSQNGYAITVDGVMGPETAKALRSFQSERGLRSTGTLDRDTLSALDMKTDRAPASVDDSSKDVMDDVNRVK